MRYLIIGNSAAAVGAIESIRSVDKAGSVTVVSDEPYHVYSRPLIAHYLAGETPAEKMNYRGLDFYEKYQVTPRLGNKVVEVDFTNRVVKTDQGEGIPYDRLLITTGSRVTAPRIPGSDLKGVSFFQKWDDAKSILENLQPTKKAVVIGAGLIGMRAAYGLLEAGAQVTVIEFLPRILSRVLDPQGSKMVEDILSKGGVQVITGRSVKEIIGGGSKVNGVLLDDGQKIDCNVVVIATGVAPNIELVKNSGIRIGNGILVNEFFQTSFSDVYAAGDVAETYDIPRGRSMVNANWANAHEQGRIAGLNMAGKVTKFQGSLGMNSVSFFGVPVISLGLFDPESEGLTGYDIKVRTNPQVNIYQKLVFKDNRLKGAIFIGDLGFAGTVKELIRDQSLVGIIKDAILEEKYQFYGFLKKKRQAKFEGQNIKWKETYSSTTPYQKSFNEETWTQRERNERQWR